MKVGDVIEEKYELTQLLGEGGIVQTFEAVDRGNERKVIVKRLDPELGVDSDVIERLVFEAQTVGGMGSEFTVAVLDAGEADDELPYLVMERLEGSELSTIIQRERRPFAPHRAVAIALQLCRGVGAAHQRGVLHLGLRPQKLLVSRRGVGTERLKILDFGFARVRELLSEQDPSLLSGPPYYTAPEILQETHEVDHRADIYSAGVILYELLTSNVPFQAENFDDLVVLVATTNPRKPRDLRPNLTAELEQVVLKAIDREADNRYSNMEELSEALAPFAASSAASAPPPQFASTAPAAASKMAQAAPPETAPSEPAPSEPAPSEPAPSEPVETSSSMKYQVPEPSQRSPEPLSTVELPPAPPETIQSPGASEPESPQATQSGSAAPSEGDQPPRVGPPLKSPPIEPSSPPQSAQSPVPDEPSKAPPSVASSPAPPPSAEPPMVTPQPTSGVDEPGPMASPPPVGEPLPQLTPEPSEPPRVAEPPRVERQTPPTEDGAPNAVDDSAAAKPAPERKLRASERAVLEAGRAKSTRRDEVKRKKPQAQAATKKSPLLRVLLLVLIVGVLLGSAIAVGFMYIERLDNDGSRVTTPPQKAPDRNVDTSRQPQKVPGKAVGVVTPSDAPPPEQAPVTLTENLWVTITGTGSSKIILGISSDRLPARVRGFRPALGVLAPDYDFEMQHHEVSIGELQPWLLVNPDHGFEPPDWLPEDEALLFPATGIPWSSAKAYCESIGGGLPTEVEWEFAARGLDSRSNPWGSRPIELEKTHVFRQGGPLSKVMTNAQDVTPGTPEKAIFDLAGNALEWTADQYRVDGPESEELFEALEGVIFRTVRGLAPAGEHPGHIQADGAAYRSAQCAEGPCQPPENERLKHVGFRCVRRPADAPETSSFPPEASLPTIQPLEKAPPADRPPQKRRTTGPIAPNPYR